MFKMLFYGPPGCGKTFFAEKMAEEVEINFMKIVPDNLASTYVHQTKDALCKTCSINSADNLTYRSENNL